MQTSSIGELEEEGGPEKGEAQRHWLQESVVSVSPLEDISTIRYETMKLGRKLGVGFRALSLVFLLGS